MKDIIIDFSHYDDMAAFHKDIKEKLDFPEYYGENLDALHDLVDSIPEDAYHFLFFYGGKLPHKQQVQIAKILLRKI